MFNRRLLPSFRKLILIYHLMKDTLGKGKDEMSEIFDEWNQGELDSFLIEISTAILKYKDDKGEFLLE